MENKFNGKAIVITGGGSGIGKATALAFTREGTKVYIVDTNEMWGKETVAQIEQDGGVGYFYQGDVVACQKKRERRFQLQVERLNEFLKDREPKRGSDGKEIQSNTVDNESVKMPSSHGVVQGYNAQALVDSKHQVIRAAETFASQDHENLKPMLEGAKKNLQAIGKDKSYFPFRWRASRRT